MLGYILFTWGIGLIPPFLIRYILYKRQMGKNMAVIVCAAFWIFNLILFISLGSQSKTHAVLLLIALVSYKILRIAPKDKEILSINTKPHEPHSWALRWYKLLVFQLKWRLFFSATLPFVVIGGGFLLGAYVQTTEENERFAALTIEEKAECARLEYEIDTNHSPEYSYRLSNCQHDRYFRNVQEFIPDVILNWVVITVGLFALLTAISLYYCEHEIGWRRLAIVIAILFSVVSILAPLVIEDGLEFSFSTLAMILLPSFAAFPMGILLILGGRSIYLWVRSGFVNTPDSSNKT